MSLFDVKKTGVAMAIAMTIMIWGISDASAQSRREIERERQRVARDRQQQTRQNRPTMNRREFANAYFQSGYEPGYLAGSNDRRRGKYNRSNVYRDTGSYPNQGDPTSGDYIYRQGYLAGYDDGFYGGRNP